MPHASKGAGRRRHWGSPCVGWLLLDRRARTLRQTSCADPSLDLGKLSSLGECLGSVNSFQATFLRTSRERCVQAGSIRHRHCKADELFSCNRPHASQHSLGNIITRKSARDHDQGDRLSCIHLQRYEPPRLVRQYASTFKSPSKYKVSQEMPAERRMPNTLAMQLNEISVQIIGGLRPLPRSSLLLITVEACQKLGLQPIVIVFLQVGRNTILLWPPLIVVPLPFFRSGRLRTG